MNAATISPATDVLSRQDRCDRCGAQAYTRATLPGGAGDLLFCGHHFRALESALVGAGASVLDERHRIGQEAAAREA